MPCAWAEIKFLVELLDFQQKMVYIIGIDVFL